MTAFVWPWRLPRAFGQWIIGVNFLWSPCLLYERVGWGGLRANGLEGVVQEVSPKLPALSALIQAGNIFSKFAFLIHPPPQHSIPL